MQIYWIGAKIYLFQQMLGGKELSARGNLLPQEQLPPNQLSATNSGKCTSELTSRRSKSSIDDHSLMYICVLNCRPDNDEGPENQPEVSSKPSSPLKDSVPEIETPNILPVPEIKNTEAVGDSSTASPMKIPESSASENIMPSLVFGEPQMPDKKSKR